jgi:perosamine synthetase
LNPVELFEAEFAKYVGIEPELAVATSSGTASLIAGILALDLPPNSRIITTPFTFPATANAILIAGHKPVFVDIKKDCLIDPAQVEKASGKCDAVLAVHLFGDACDIGELHRITENEGLHLIEDCSQSFGRRDYKDRHVGTVGDVGTFSFYASKNLPAYEGGMITSRYPEIAKRARRYINHGFENGDMVSLGYNFKMPWINAFLGWQHLLLHKPGIEAELGRYGLKDGYYPKLVYHHDWYQKNRLRWANYPCPVAEKMAEYVRGLKK